MEDTVQRIMPFWYNTIARNVFNNKKVLIVAHKNSLRAIFKHLQNISDEDIKKFKVPNAMPMVYEFDERMTFVNNYTLMDLDSHRLRKEDPTLSYNNINVDMYDSIDPKMRLQQASKEFQLDRKHDAARMRSVLK